MNHVEVSVCHNKFDYFYHQVLKCISQLELAQLIGSGVKYNQSGGKKDKRSANIAPTMDTFDPEGNILLNHFALIRAGWWFLHNNNRSNLKLTLKFDTPASQKNKLTTLYKCHIISESSLI